MKLFFKTLTLMLLAGITKVGFAQEGQLHLVANIPVTLKENSSLIAEKSGLWTMNDGPSTILYKIDEKTGTILQEVNITNQNTTDTEAITADDQYFYIGDFGNNHEPRTSFKILRIKKADINPAAKQDVAAEEISFTYDDFNSIALEKSTGLFDCEAMLSYQNKLYLFTKRRSDNQTVLYAVSKNPGKQQAKRLAVFDSKGLITGAAINPKGTEVALIGYKHGHKESFVWILSRFNQDNFLSGVKKQVGIFQKIASWQTEGITYKNQDELFISCEQTKDVNCRLYQVTHDQLINNK